jgi:hypothetical protein
MLCVRNEDTKRKIIKLLNEGIKRSNEKSIVTVSEINNGLTSVPAKHNRLLSDSSQ